jgi:hypothetical protein
MNGIGHGHWQVVRELDRRNVGNPHRNLPGEETRALPFARDRASTCRRRIEGYRLDEDILPGM